MMAKFSKGSVVLALAAALVSVSANKTPDILYNGKNLHLNPQYRLRHAEFEKQSSPQPEPEPEEIISHLPPEEKIRHFEFYNGRRSSSQESVTRSEQEEYEGHGLSEITIPAFPTVASDTEHDTTTRARQSTSSQQVLNSFSMFAMWSLDTLFWLVPFVAHSNLFALVYFAAYQTMVFMSIYGMPMPVPTVAHAHVLNMVWGAGGAAMCWMLAFYYCVRLHQREDLIEIAARSSSQQAKQDSYPLGKDDDLEAPLLKPSTIADDIVAHLPQVVPGILLIIVMTVVSLADDIFFVPVMASHGMSFAAITSGSVISALLWAFVALIVADRLRPQLASIPLYVVLCIYASTMMGHSMWDVLHTDQSHLLWERLGQVNWLRLFFPGHF